MSETIKQTGYPSKLRLHEKDATFFQKHPVIPGCSIFSLIKYTSRKYRKEIAVEDVGKKISFERLILKSSAFNSSFVTVDTSNLREDDGIANLEPYFTYVKTSN